MGRARQDMERIRELFVLVMELPAEQRARVLRERCAGDTGVLEEVEALLRYHEPGSDFLESPALAGVELGAEGETIAAVGAFEPGQVVGGFTIERLIGAGGMGIVYAAKQHEPERRVALKVMRPGLASQAALRRFSREGAALARLTHAGIAAVYAAGVGRSPSGVVHPYLALELVEGRALDEHVRGAGGRPAERVELFLQIADAVSHAHQRGVVHRDLKPANILVTANGAARVLDFGIARLLGDDEGLRDTRAGQLAGTLAYMSPEQLDAGRGGVDVRSDVYSLGVILYEMLSGVLPIDLSGEPLDRAMALVRERRPALLGDLDRRLRGDVEVIVAKALEKEPARRYDSAAALAEDLRRWLRHEPIAARPAGRVYRAGKFVRRHRVLVVAAAAIVLSMGAGLGTTIWQARSAERARLAAERRAAVTAQTNEFLRDLFLAAERARLRGDDATLHGAVTDAAQRLEREGPKSALVEAEIRGTIGHVYSMLGDHARARDHHEKALEILDRELGPAAAESLVGAAALALARSLLGEAEEAERLVRARLDAAHQGEAGRGPRARLLTVLARVTDDAAQARAAAEEAADLCAAVFGPEHEHTLAALSNLARAMGRTGDWSDAERVARECLAVRTRNLTPDHPDRVYTAEQLAAAVRRQGRVEESAALMEEVVVMGGRVVPVDHPEQVENRLSAASVLHREGHYARAESMVRAALPLTYVADRPTPNTVRCLGFLSQILVRQERYEEAEAIAGRTVATAEIVHPTAPGGEPPIGQVLSWTAYYNLYARWQKPEQLEEWRQKLRATPTGREILRVAGQHEVEER